MYTSTFLTYKPIAEINKERLLGLSSVYNREQIVPFPEDDIIELISDIDDTIGYTDYSIDNINNHYADYSFPIQENQLSPELRDSIKKVDGTSNGEKLTYPTYKEVIEKTVNIEEVSLDGIEDQLGEDPTINNNIINSYIVAQDPSYLENKVHYDNILSYTSTYFKTTTDTGTQGLESLPELFRNKKSLQSNKSVLTSYLDKGYDVDPLILGSIRSSQKESSNFAILSNNSLSGYLNSEEISSVVNKVMNYGENDLNAASYVFSEKKSTLMGESLIMSNALKSVKSGTNTVNLSYLISKDGIGQMIKQLPIVSEIRGKFL